MKITDLRKELCKIVQKQRLVAASLDATNPSVKRLIHCAEDTAEICEAIIKAINGDKVMLRLYQ